MARSDVNAGTSSSNVSPRPSSLNALDWISLLLMIVGSINWGLVGAFDFDLVATIFGSGSTLSRIVYILVGLAGLYGLVLLARLSSRNHTP